jgi:hypothetical protein
MLNSEEIVQIKVINTIVIQKVNWLNDQWEVSEYEHWSEYID